MSNKIALAEVIETLKKHKLPPPELRAIVEELNAKLAETESEKDESVPRQKTQHVIILADKEGKLPKQDIMGWVVAIPEDASPATAVSLVQAAAHDFNATKKGRLLPVTTFGEAMESVKRKLFKERGVKVLTKLPVLAMTSDNSIGEAPSV